MLLTLSSCVKQPEYSIIPHIEFKSISATTVYTTASAGSQTDTVTLTFTDGDGDIGPPSSDQGTGDINDCTDHSKDSLTINNPHYNLYWYFYRAGDSCITQNITANLPNDGKYKAITGEIQFYPQVECGPNGGTDTVFLSVFIKDRAGHISNRVRTPYVTVVCN